MATLHLLIFQQFVVIFEGEFYFSQNLSYQGAGENYTFVMWNCGGSSVRMPIEGVGFPFGGFSQSLIEAKVSPSFWHQLSEA